MDMDKPSPSHEITLNVGPSLGMRFDTCKVMNEKCPPPPPNDFCTVVFKNVKNCVLSHEIMLNHEPSWGAHPMKSR